jgi:hypothetical protein
VPRPSAIRLERAGAGIEFRRSRFLILPASQAVSRAGNFLIRLKPNQKTGRMIAWRGEPFDSTIVGKVRAALDPAAVFVCRSGGLVLVDLKSTLPRTDRSLNSAVPRHSSCECLPGNQF